MSKGKKIVILTGSPRKSGNSDLMAEAFAEGARAGGHEVLVYSAGRSDIKGCRACGQCFSKGKPCIFDDDDYNNLAPQLEAADMLVLAAPVYYYTFPAQLKAVIDRFYCYSYSGRPLKNKESVLLSCAEESREAAFKPTIETYKAICWYLNWKDLGIITAMGVNAKGDIKDTDYLDKCRELGKSV